ncbi:Tn3 family transposase [Nonomuraea sp. K271]|nr:Tn3 family transposase [Nonomuraea sp. K271]
MSVPATVQYWDDMVRVAGSLSTNKVRAYDLIKRMTADGRLTGLGEAFAAYGRIFKTLHLLQIIHLESYRRMIGTQHRRVPPPARPPRLLRQPRPAPSSLRARHGEPARRPRPWPERHHLVEQPLHRRRRRPAAGRRPGHQPRDQSPPVTAGVQAHQLPRLLPLPPPPPGGRTPAGPTRPQRRRGRAAGVGHLVSENPTARTDEAPVGPGFTVPSRPDGWPDLLGRRPLTSTERADLRRALEAEATPAGTTPDPLFLAYLTIDGLDRAGDPRKRDAATRPDPRRCGGACAERLARTETACVVLAG